MLSTVEFQSQDISSNGMVGQVQDAPPLCQGELPHTTTGNRPYLLNCWMVGKGSKKYEDFPLSLQPFKRFIK